jgi:hypothetical protein
MRYLIRCKVNSDKIYIVNLIYLLLGDDVILSSGHIIELKLDTYKNVSRIIKLRLNKRKSVSINTKITLGVLSEYERLKKDEILDYKVLTCHMLYKMIILKDRETVSLDEILQIDNEILIKVGKQIIMNIPELEEYYQANREFFEAFILAFDLYLDKVNRDLIEIIKPFSESIQKSISSINNIIKQGAQEINKSLIEAIKPIEGFKEWSRGILQQYNDAFQCFYKYGDVANRFYIIMLELDYPPFILDYVRMKEIVESYEQHGIEKVENNIERHVIAYYNKVILEEMISCWKKQEWLYNRIKILEDATQIYLEGRYNLVVPVILAQIEGIIADGFSHQGKMGGKNLNLYINNLISNDVSNFSGKFELMAKNFINNVILVQFIHGQETQPSLSRHAILHGADTEYGTQINALKALLLFNFIQEMISEKKLANSI